MKYKFKDCLLEGSIYKLKYYISGMKLKHFISVIVTMETYIIGSNVYVSYIKHILCL